MNNREKIAYLYGMIAHNDLNDREALKEAVRMGFKKDEHVGMNPYFFEKDPDNHVADWIGGQLITILGSTKPKDEALAHQHFLARLSLETMMRDFLNGSFGYVKDGQWL